MGGSFFLLALSFPQGSTIFPYCDIITVLIRENMVFYFYICDSLAGLHLCRRNRDCAKETN